MIIEEYARMPISALLRVHRDGRTLKDIGAIWRACHIAFTQLGEVKRRSGGWAIEHAMLVAEKADEYELSIQAIAAAILHDVIEDSPIGYTSAEIEAAFENYGPLIAFLVCALTKQEGTSEEDYFNQIVCAVETEWEVIFIKLFDRLDGQEWPYDREDSPNYLDRARHYYQETLGPFSDMCRRCRSYVPECRLGEFDKLLTEINQLAAARLVSLSARI